MTKLHELARLGQSVWLDFIRRSLLEKGELRKLVEQGIRGVTSNPTIFDRAISGSDDYDEDLRPLSCEAKSPEEIFEVLAFRDITLAADILRPVYEATGGLDGYVSLEVSPRLAHDAAGTVAEVRRYFRTLDRPNVLIKVPATPAGIHAVQTLISEGININVTLIFSLAQYEAVAEAYISGLEKFHDRGGQISKIASVASFFVSRVDTAVDRALERMGLTELQGKAAVANAKLAYARFREIFGGERWQRLARKGARVQRPLWASTSTKNPKYPDTLYVDNLIGPDTVNTMPPETLAAVLDHGRVALTVEEGLDEARAHLARLAEVGIDLDKITQQLQDEGVDAFAKSFASLLASIAAKCENIHGVF